MKWTLERDENAHKFAITNAYKDMRCVTSLANSVGTLNPIQSAVRNSFAAMDAAGEGEGVNATCSLVRIVLDLRGRALAFVKRDAYGLDGACAEFLQFFDVTEEIAPAAG